MDALELIRSRRSTRSYRDTPVEPEKLQAVVEAGRYAPSGGNSQTTHFFVIQDQDVLAELAGTVQACFAEMETTPDMYASMARAITRSKKGGYVFHYGAPVLIVCANRRDYPNNLADCACAQENMMLMANALDLGSCWINQLRWLNEDERLLRRFRELGMGEDECIFASMALGYPATENGLPERQPLSRKGNPVTMV